MKQKGYRAWQMVVLGLLAAAMVVSLMIPESLLTPPGPKRVEISILLRQGDSEVFSTARQGMEQAAEDLGAELRFLTLEAEDDGISQVELLRRQAEMDVDAAVVIPADCTALEQLLDDWQGLPVVTLESQVAGAQAFVGIDDEAVGRMLAQQVAGSCPASGRVLLADAFPGCAGPSRRLESAKQTLKTAGFAPEVCSELTVEALEGAAAVLCFEPVSLEQAAALAAQCEAAPLVYGAGVSASVVASLETGGIAAAIAWSDYAAGYLAVSQAAAAARGEQAESQTLPVTLVKEGETYDKDHQKLLYPVFS
ncbi:substrate-binding domain-containing protein [Allofournierella sp.]|uniref:sugar ABC transporter substrate-binding protein n=1 Tax=Allofournierella sp. TaxID=1940256 RepID=UPI0025B98571|nr:substrate-binding domain-containing protein [Fournierella sp.]